MRADMIKRGRAKVLLAATVLVAGVAWSVPTAAQVGGALQPPQACENPTKTMTLYAKRIGRTKIGYGLTQDKPTIPGPTIEMVEGDCLQVTLVNDTDVRLSMHAHGVDYTTESDGSPLHDGCVGPGRARTFVFQAHPPTQRADGTIDPGSAGYWHYHDHCVGTEHGTGGVASGLFGALVVRRAGDPVPDRTCVLTMVNISFNLKVAPRTPKCTSTLGDRVEFVVIGHGELFHTFHMHGHRWVDSRTGLPSGLNDPTQVIDNKTVGPADSFGFQVIAGEHVGPGAWMYHCHVQGHSDAGMTGVFVVMTEEGMLTRATREALRQWVRSSRSHERSDAHAAAGHH